MFFSAQYTTKLSNQDSYEGLKCRKWAETRGCAVFHGEERVCLHCAVLRVAPSTHVAESKAQRCVHRFMHGPGHCNTTLGLFIKPLLSFSQALSSSPSPSSPAFVTSSITSTAHLSALATGSIATGDEARGGGGCMCV